MDWASAAGAAAGFLGLIGLHVADAYTFRDHKNKMRERRSPMKNVLWAVTDSAVVAAGDIGAAVLASSLSRAFR